jgi:hypothetical protein
MFEGGGRRRRRERERARASESSIELAGEVESVYKGAWFVENEVIEVGKGCAGQGKRQSRGTEAARGSAPLRAVAVNSEPRTRLDTFQSGDEGMVKRDGVNGRSGRKGAAWVRASWRRPVAG